MALSAQESALGIPPSALEGVMDEAMKDASAGMTTGHIIGWLVFGLIGMAAFSYGRKQASPKAMIIGALLMIYPYAVTHLVALWVVGAGLTGYLLINRN